MTSDPRNCVHYNEPFHHRQKHATIKCKLNVTSRPESLAAIRQASSLWGSMDMQAMFEIRAPDDSTIYSIYAPTQ